MCFPRGRNDSKPATFSGLLYPNLADEMTPFGMAILGNSVFVVGSRVTGVKVVRTHKIKETKRVLENLEIAAIDLIIQRVLPSERQSAEWET